MRSLSALAFLWTAAVAALSGCAGDVILPGSPMPFPAAALFAASAPTPTERAVAQRTIAAMLFGISLADIDKPDIGANYDYNHYGEDAEPENTCNGYAGGHAGTDLQTKDVEGMATADRQVFSLTDGDVVGVDAANGRVFIKSTIALRDARGQAATKFESVQWGYFHLRQIFVKAGDKTSPGRPLGIQGNLGLGLVATDTTAREHVHVEVRASNASVGAACGAAPRDATGSAKDGALDPQPYFEAIANSVGLRLR